MAPRDDKKKIKRNPSQGPLIRRRRRRVTSCVMCRQKKAKCSREQPCERCRQSGEDCVYIGTSAEYEDAPPPQRVVKTRNRPVNTCQSCRTRRVHCDRGNPCARCTNDGFQCSYQRYPAKGPANPPIKDEEPSPSPSPLPSASPSPPPTNTRRRRRAPASRRVLDDPYDADIPDDTSTQRHNFDPSIHYYQHQNSRPQLDQPHQAQQNAQPSRDTYTHPLGYPGNVAQFGSQQWGYQQPPPLAPSFQVNQSTQLSYTGGLAQLRHRESMNPYANRPAFPQYPSPFSSNPPYQAPQLPLMPWSYHQIHQQQPRQLGSDFYGPQGDAYHQRTGWEDADEGEDTPNEDSKSLR